MVSVVIPARNAACALASTLAALDQPDVREVIVVDNGSADATAAVARSAGAAVISVPTPRRATARNRGAEAARADRIAFLDADCVPDPGWATAMSRCLAESPLAGGAVRVTTTAQPGPSERFDVLWRFQQERTIRDGGWAASANLGMTRSAFEAVGGFEPAYSSAEDVDFCIRAGRLGLRIAWCPGAVVSHPASRSMREVLERGFRQGRESTRLHCRLDGAIGRHYWRRPGGIARGRAALRALDVDPSALEPAERRSMALVAQLEYLARFLGSSAAQLRRP